MLMMYSGSIKTILVKCCQTSDRDQTKTFEVSKGLQIERPYCFLLSLGLQCTVRVCVCVRVRL